MIKEGKQRAQVKFERPHTQQLLCSGAYDKATFQRRQYKHWY